MPIRSRISDYTSRLKLKRGSKELHPLIANRGTKHSAVWFTLSEAGRKGLTAAQLQAREHNYHPQVLADLIANGLVQKLGRKEGNQFVYTADPSGRGHLTQRVEVKVELYETNNGQLVTRTLVQGIRGKPDQVVKLLGSRTIGFTIPIKDGKTVVPVSADEVVLDNAQGYQPAPEKQAIGRAIQYIPGFEPPGSTIIDG
jgi:hypothetical protein